MGQGSGAAGEPLETGGPALRADLARYYDQDAARRAVRPLNEDRVRRRGDFVAMLRERGMTCVLEVGVGPGIDAVALQDAGLAVAGVDLSSEHVRLARAAGIDAKVAAAQDLPFGDGSFDALWCASVLMHMPDVDLDLALAEFARVLRPDGLAALGTWGGDGTSGANPDDTIRPPRYFNWRTDEAILAAVRRHLDVVEFETWTVGSRPDRYQWCIARRDGSAGD